MNKSVRFSEEPVLVRQISDRSDERTRNSQTDFEKSLATKIFFVEEKKKYNTDKETKEKYENKQKYIDTPIDKRVSDAILKGNKEDVKIRNAAMVEEHKYDYWWLGGKKSKKTKKTKNKRKCRRRKPKGTKKNRYY
jgi:hypothetical protein